MRKTILPLLAVSALSVSACATGMGGPGVLGSVLGNVLSSGAQGRGGPDFQTMAIEACGSEASRYGRVSVSDVEAVSRSTMRVYGTVDTGSFQRRAFACNFRDDGRITDFDWGR